MSQKLSRLFGSSWARLVSICHSEAWKSSSSHFKPWKKLVSARFTTLRLDIGSSEVKPAKFLAQSTSTINAIVISLFGRKCPFNAIVIRLFGRKCPVVDNAFTHFNFRDSWMKMHWKPCTKFWGTFSSGEQGLFWLKDSLTLITICG